jgi:CubicO group peptidase (beta-lactamase class C family)
MKKPLARFALLAGLLLTIQTASKIAWAQSSVVAAPQGIARCLQPYVDSHTLAGAVTLVASPDKVLCLEAVGYADIAARKPMQTDNLFWIASMTKPITATALMMLVDDGKVNVDDPVEKYLPEFKGQKLALEQEKGKVVLQKPAHPITVKNLLTHTSGLTGRAAAGQRWDMTSLRTAVECYAACPLKFEPGSKYEYSNAGINTAGRIVEVAGGMPYEEFMARRLFTPLGMKDTTYWPTPSQFQRLAKAYQPTADKTGLEEMPTLPVVDRKTGRKSMAFPAGGLFSTATDVSLFCRMILRGGEWEGKRYLSEKAIRQMTSTQTGDLPTHYGFGWSTDPSPGGPFGHAGAHKTEMHIFPRQQLITVLMVQHGDWRNEEGRKILPTFQQAALKTFSK